MPSLTSTCLLTVAARPSPKLPARYFPTSLCHSKRGKNRVCTICKSYHELRSAAEGAYERARSLLPELERAQAIAAEARDPASEAERRWQDAHGRLVAVQGGAHEAIQEVRARALRALGGSDHLIDSMLRHHTAWRVQNFRQKSPSASSDTVIWSECPPNVTPLTWLPGAAMLAHSLIMVKDGFPYLIASIAVATPPFVTSQQDSLRSLLLHWSVADGPGAGWANSIPQGWHTSPGISHPCGSTAWQTHFAPYTPVLGHSKEGINGVTVFSVIVQIPMEGFLESRGGLKFVLKRSDGGQPEWIKPANNADFWLDFEPSIAALTAIKQKLEGDETENIAQTAGDPDVDSIDEWGWARILTAGTANTAAEMDFPGLTNVSDQNACAWLCAVSRWAEVPSTNGDVSTSSIPEQHHSFSKQMEQLRTILAAELDFTKDQTHSTIDEKVKDGKDELIKSKVQEIESLLQRCNQVDGALQRYDLASLEARKEQVDKERLWDIYKNASNEASRLEAEAAAVVQEARQSVAALRGRSNPPKEVTIGDLDRLAAGIAESSFDCGQELQGKLMPPTSLVPFWIKGSESNRKQLQEASTGNRLAFVSRMQSAMQGLNGEVVAHVYLAQGQVQGQEREQEQGDGDGDGDKSGGGVFDTIIISVGVGESFPEAETWGPDAPALHFGMVAHQHGKWRPPPSGWCSPMQRKQQQLQENGALPWVPLQAYRTTTMDGRPAFVDPLTFGCFLSLPLTDTIAAGFHGVEFVVKTQTGRWLQAAGSGNFYVELPF